MKIWLRLSAFTFLTVLGAILAMLLIASSISTGELIAAAPSRHYETFGTSLFWMDVRTGKEVRITLPELNAFWPAWSPDGSRLLFSADIGNRQQFFVTDFPAYQPQNLFIPQRMRLLNPRWSPDGQRIVFESDGSSSGVLFVYDLLADSFRSIDLRPEAFAHAPRWSPDGQQLAFYASGVTDGDLFLYQVADNRTDQLTDNDDADWNPSWSPDGRWLIYKVYDGRTAHALYAYELSTQHKTRLTEAVGFHSPWSPDGRWIAFIANQPGSSRAMMLLDTRCLMQALDCADFVFPVGVDHISDNEILWSPDSRLLIFSRSDTEIERYLADVTCLNETRCRTPEVQLLPPLAGISIYSWRPSPS